MGANEYQLFVSMLQGICPDSSRYDTPNCTKDAAAEFVAKEASTTGTHNSGANAPFFTIAPEFDFRSWRSLSLAVVIVTIGVSSWARGGRGTVGVGVLKRSTLVIIALVVRWLLILLWRLYLY